ncbi:MAG TPA: hypothetical protein VN408_24700 [Actinoplanes sp.]|nr:hypothetical protein [Actinoplanes sp.]
MTDYDLEAQQSTTDRTMSKWAKESVSKLVHRSHPNADTMIADLSAITTTATTFASSINNYAFQSDKVQRGIDITNAITSLGTTAEQGLQAYRSGNVSDPYYITANVTSFALSVGRTAVDLAMEPGVTKETAKFAIDMAQMATQVAKWGTKPSAKKAKGAEYDDLAASVHQLQSEVQSVRSMFASGSVHSTHSAPVATSSGHRHSPPSSSKGRRK